MQKNKLIIITILIIIFIGTVITFFLKENNNYQNQDALKFKEEYESLNNTIRESDGATYNNVNIPEDNPIQYISASKAVDIIENQTGIIYFGANWCPWCRNAIEVLLNSASSNNLETIYYLNMDEVRNIWEVRDNKLVKTQEEQEGYYELLESLDNVLGDNTYTLKDTAGNIYDTKEKRIYMPFIIAVKNGKIVKTHLGTVKLDEGQTKYDKLTTSQISELTKIYDELIQSITNEDVCKLDEACS